MVETLPINACA